jgi:hypothetical protein
VEGFYSAAVFIGDKKTLSGEERVWNKTKLNMETNKRNAVC